MRALSGDQTNLSPHPLPEGMVNMGLLNHDRVPVMTTRHAWAVMRIHTCAPLLCPLKYQARKHLIEVGKLHPGAIESSWVIGA